MKTKTIQSAMQQHRMHKFGSFFSTRNFSAKMLKNTWNMRKD